jgi:putative FmdB family regulatory protein
VPIFDYQCLGCEAVFEDLVRAPDDTEGVACPTCGSRKVTRTISLFAAGSSRTAETRALTSSRKSPGGGGCGTGCGCH